MSQTSSPPPTGDVIGDLVALVERETAKLGNRDAWPAILAIAQVRGVSGKCLGEFRKLVWQARNATINSQAVGPRRKRASASRRVGIWPAPSCTAVQRAESGADKLRAIRFAAQRYRRRTVTSMSVSTHGKRPPINKTTTRLICQRLIQGMSMSQACATHDVPSASAVYLRTADDEAYGLKTPLITTQRHYTRPRVRENSGCWSSSRVNASISGCNQRSGIVGIRS